VQNQVDNELMFLRSDWSRYLHFQYTR